MNASEETLKSVFKESYHALTYFAFKILNSRSEAEDIVQDAFIKYWDQRDEISDDLPAIKSYLYTSVKNSCFNVLRHRSVSEKYLQKTSGAGIIHEKDALEILLEAETMALVFKAVDKLPPVCRRITQMSYLQGKKNDEIAAELGISVNSVKTHKQRAAQLLRKKLSPEILGFILFFF